MNAGNRLWAHPLNVGGTARGATRQTVRANAAAREARSGGKPQGKNHRVWNGNAAAASKPEPCAAGGEPKRRWQVGKQSELCAAGSSVRRRKEPRQRTGRTGERQKGRLKNPNRAKAVRDALGGSRGNAAWLAGRVAAK